MPADRLLSPRLGQSRKVSLLSDFAARAWSNGWLLCADDFGVMPNEPAILQGFNRRFAKESAEVITAAIRDLLAVGLLLEFQHQDQSYLFDPMWQDFQHVKWPRRTINPCPPPELLARCSAETLTLFRLHGSFPKDFKKLRNPSLAMSSRPQANNNPPVLVSREEGEGEKGGEGGARGPSPRARIKFTGDLIVGITDSDCRRWQELAPAVDLEVELLKAQEWLHNHPERRRSNIAQFLVNWLTKAQDHAVRRRPPSAASRTEANVTAAWEAVERIKAKYGRRRES